MCVNMYSLHFTLPESVKSERFAEAPPEMTKMTHHYAVWYEERKKTKQTSEKEGRRVCENISARLESEIQMEIRHESSTAVLVLSGHFNTFCCLLSDASFEIERRSSLAASKSVINLAENKLALRNGGRRRPQSIAISLSIPA